MEETKYIWMNGKFVNWKDAKIHVLSHTLHYGMGIFEGLRFYKTENGPAIFRVKDHTKRFFNGTKTCFMKLPFSQDEINKAIVETVAKNEISSGYIRPLAFYGYGKMGLDPHGAQVNVIIAVWPWGSYLGEDAVKVKTSSFMRIHPKSTHAQAKICGHYVNSIFSSLEAKEKGYEEALLLDYEGNIGEGPGENFFFVKDGKLITPKLGNILEGLTRNSIIEIAKDEGIEVVEKDLKLDDAYSADEAFFTGTAAEVTPIASIDDKKIGKGSQGPITSKIKQIYLDTVHGRNKKYKKWLTYVDK